MPAICRAAYAAAMAAQGRSNQARTRSALGIMHLRLGSRTPATPGAGGPGAGLPDLLQHDLPGKLSRRSAWPGRKGARGGLPQEQSPCLLLRSGTQGSPAPALRHGRPAPGARQCGGPATEQGCRDGGGGKGGQGAGGRPPPSLPILRRYERVVSTLVSVALFYTTTNTLPWDLPGGVLGARACFYISLLSLVC